MYRHLLIPSDGSEVAELAVTAGIDFPRPIGPRVTAFTAMPEYRLPGQGELMSRKLVPSPKQHEDRAKREADTILAAIAEKARADGGGGDGGYA